MWGSILLGAFFIYENRITEAYATISTVARFALGCGLDGTTPGSFLSPNSQSASFRAESVYVAEFPLLPHPDLLTRDEARDRYHLSHAIYMMDRTLTMTAGYPGCFSPKSSLSAEWLKDVAVMAGAMSFEGKGVLNYDRVSSDHLTDTRTHLTNFTQKLYYHRLSSWQASWLTLSTPSNQLSFNVCFSMIGLSDLHCMSKVWSEVCVSHIARANRAYVAMFLFLCNRARPFPIKLDSSTRALYSTRTVSPQTSPTFRYALHPCIRGIFLFESAYYCRSLYLLRECHLAGKHGW